MPTTETDWDAETEALRKRLEILAAGRTKSEIARKTNTSVTNVARYLAGTRMPTEFSVAVVRGLGVNPAGGLQAKARPMFRTSLQAPLPWAATCLNWSRP